MAEENITLIDAQTDVEGKLRGKDALVRGRFKGEIEVSGKLVLGEGSRVEATVVADAAEISGELKGDVKARSLVLAEKARVQGTVDAQVLVVREGAWLSGSVAAGETKAAKPAPTPVPTPKPTGAPGGGPGGGGPGGGGEAKQG
jgi:cytoskeletal protein CcmA (bactofilin family)